mmetsp:Transcript_87208/g.241860  ORF Transcript_87208/g.241860 Transcript_87208/m.241860 type:complete len:202 (-) Transcript_87208:434-1039(-)
MSSSNLASWSLQRGLCRLSLKTSSEWRPTSRCVPRDRATFSTCRCSALRSSHAQLTYTSSCASHGNSLVPWASTMRSTSPCGGSVSGRGGGRCLPFTRTAKVSQSEEETAMMLMAELWSRSFASQLWQTSHGQRGLILLFGSRTATASIVWAAWNWDAAVAMPARSAQRDPLGKLTSVFMPRCATSAPSAQRQTTTASTTW